MPREEEEKRVRAMLEDKDFYPNYSKEHREHIAKAVVYGPKEKKRKHRIW